MRPFFDRIYQDCIYQERRPRRARATRLALATLLAFASAAGIQAESGEGGALFARQCAECHSLEAPPADLLAVAAQGGPGLHDAGTRLDPAWVEDFLQAPRRVRPAGFLPHRYTVPTAEGDRLDLARLPEHPRLDAADSAAVASFLAEQTQPMQPYPPAEKNPAIRAQVHFSKILPCGGCHRVDGDGGVSGPDLSAVAGRLQPEWLHSFIWDPQAWGHPLMPKTRLRADQALALADYLREVDAAPQDAVLAEGQLLGGETPVELAPVLAEHERAAGLYQLLCSQCHGVQGDGKGLNAPHLFMSPRDHTSYDEMSRLTDQRIFEAISYGGAAVGKSSLMPSWGAVIAEDDIWLLVAYLRELSGTL